MNSVNFVADENLDNRRMNTYHSNRVMLFWYRYAPLIGVFICVGSMVKNSRTVGVDGVIAEVAGALIFFAVFLLARLLVFSASVSEEGVRLDKNRLIIWNEIASIDRLGNLYIIRIRGSLRIRFFPIEDFYNPFLGKKVEDDDMDQLIDIMMEKKANQNA